MPFMRKLIIFLILVALIILGLTLYTYRLQHPQSDVITLYGNVDVRQVDLGFRVGGRVINMPYQEGDLIEAGTLLAELENQPYLDQVKQARANLESIKVNYQNAENIYQRRTELISDGSISKEDLETTLSNKDALSANLKEATAALGVATKNFNDIKMYAPSKGIILTRIREPGTVVRDGDPVYTLSLSDPVWVRAFIPEPLLGIVYPNMPAEIHTDTEGGKVYQGHVGFISPVAEFTPKTVETTQLRTDLVYRLRIIVANPDNGLRQGMPVTVKLRKKASSE